MIIESTCYIQFKNNHLIAGLFILFNVCHYYYCYIGMYITRRRLDEPQLSAITCIAALNAIENTTLSFQLSIKIDNRGIEAEAEDC